jgi:hypothetical protein
MDPQLLAQFSELLKALKEIATKLPTGVPAPTTNGYNPLVISGENASVESAKAGIWGKTIGIGKFFPSSKTGTFIPPLLAGLKDLFGDIMLKQLPLRLAAAIKSALGGGVSSTFDFSSGTYLGTFNDTKLGAVGAAVMDLSKSLAIAAIGFALFSLVPWEGVVLGITSIGVILFALGAYNKLVPEAEKSIEGLHTIGQALGYISLSFIAFSLVPLGSFFSSIITLGVILAMMVGYSKKVTEGKDVISGIVDIGKALGLVALSFIAFSFVTGTGFLAGIGALGALVGAAALLANNSANIESGAALLQKLSVAFLLSSVGFLIFNFIEPESFAMGLGAITALVVGVAGLSLIKTQATIGAGLLLALSASFLIFSAGVSFLKGVDWRILATAIGGIGALALFAGVMGTFALPILIGAGLIVLLGGALAVFGIAISSLAGMDTTTLPVLGTNIGKFLTNLNENITVSTLGFLPAITLSLSGLGSALTEFGKFIPLLVTLPTSGLVNFGEVMGKFLTSLTQNIDLTTLNRTRVLIPLLTDISPVLTKLSESVQRFSQLETSLLPLKAKDIGDFFKNLDINTGWFGDADEKLDALKEFGAALGSLRSPDQSFSEFINSFSSLGNVKINVDVLSTETRKTNEILQTSVSIQSQQLNELKQQTTLLSKLQISAPSQASNQPQPIPTGVNSIKGTREQYNSSSYFIKSQ